MKRAGILNVCLALLVGCWLACLSDAYPLYAADPGFDFYDYLGRFPYRHTPTFFSTPGYPWYYPAPAIFVSYPFYKLAERTTPLIGYQFFIGTGVLLFLVAVGFAIRFLRKQAAPGSQVTLFIACVAAGCYSVSFALQRGNIEGLTWVLIALAVFAICKGRDDTAALLIGCAGSIKLYPLIFAALFLRRGGIRPLFIITVTFAALTFLGIHHLDPNLVESATAVRNGVVQWTQDYSLLLRGEMYDHSIFGLLKDLTIQSHPPYKSWLRLYYGVAGTAALLAFFLRVRRQELIRQVTFVAIAAITLPPTSFDYTLCLLYVPLGWLLIRATIGELARDLRPLLLLLTLAIAPTMFVWSPRLTGAPGALRACALVAALCMTVFGKTIRGPGEFATAPAAQPEDLHNLAT